MPIVNDHRNILGDESQVPADLAGYFHMHMMCIGMYEVTEANKTEVYRRLHLLESTGGSLMTMMGDDGPEPFPVTPEHVKGLVGFRTNVSFETAAAFNKRILKSHASDTARVMR